MSIIIKTLEDAKKSAEEHEGECLSTDYINTQTLMLWRCKNKHTWKASYANVIRGRWCLRCDCLQKKTYEFPPLCG